MKIGDYVKTKNGEISKIKEIWENERIFFETIIALDYMTTDSIYVSQKDEYIIKSSPNIIDLIEVGDYVNGCLVLFAGAVTWDNDGNILDKRVHINRSGNDFWLSDKFIETVVTKEQFESMEYKIGE